MTIIISISWRNLQVLKNFGSNVKNFSNYRLMKIKKERIIINKYGNSNIDFGTLILNYNKDTKRSPVIIPYY